MKQITKAVIPAAGMGTRFLPATKAMPKEMLPIVDKPVIQYVVEEAVAAGIQEIVIITGYHKRAIEDHFDYNFELGHRLQVSGKEEQYEEIKHISDMAKFIYIRQQQPLGNGHAVLCAEEVIGDEPFLVLWGDEFIYANPPRCKQLIDMYNEYKAPIISVIHTADEEDASKYGFVKGKTITDTLTKIEEVVEKPGLENRPSTLASVGGYLLTPDIFPILHSQKAGKGGEIWLPEAINALAKISDVYAYEIKDSIYYDCGNKVAYLKACIEFALRRDDINGEFKDYLRGLKI